MEQNNAPKPVATFIGYLEGISPSIEWLGDEMPVGTQFYAMPTPVLDRAPVIAARTTADQQAKEIGIEQIDAMLDGVLRAAGSGLRHYTMPKSLDEMRTAMRVAIEAARSIADQQAAGSVESWKLQFLTDVVTAAGLLSHGRTSKALAQRIADDAYKMRSSLFDALDSRAQPVVEDALSGGMHASIFVKVWGDAGGGDAGRIALANYAYELGKRAQPVAAGELPPKDIS